MRGGSRRRALGLFCTTNRVGICCVTKVSPCDCDSRAGRVALHQSSCGHVPSYHPRLTGDWAPRTR
eukprot:3368528-Pyramimonas_sp.AAC.1